MSVLLFQLQHNPRLVSPPPFDGCQWPAMCSHTVFTGLAELSAVPGSLLALLMLKSNFSTAVT